MFFNWWASRQSWWCCYKGRFILSAQRAATSLLQQVSTRFFFSLLTNLLETFFWYCGNSFSNVYLSYRFKSIEFRQKGLAQFNEIFTMLIRILFIFFFFSSVLIEILILTIDIFILLLISIARKKTSCSFIRKSGLHHYLFIISSFQKYAWKILIIYLHEILAQT